MKNKILRDGRRIEGGMLYWVLKSWSVLCLRTSERWLESMSSKNGLWLAARYMSFIPNVEIMSETITDKVLPAIWDNQKSENIEEKLVNKNVPKDDSNREITDLIGKIEMLEKGQTYQMEYLMNVTRSLEKQSDVGSSKEYNDKIANEQNKLDVSELNNILHTELRVVKNEFEKLRELYSEVKTCCNANAEAIASQNIEEHVEKILLRYLPPGISKEDLTKISQNLFSSHPSKEDQMVFNRNNNIGDAHELDRHIRKVVKEVLRIYDADKTGQVDYALESAGGQVLSTRCTQKYDIKSKAFSLFGFPLYYESSNPRTVIQGHPLQPGVCWAFQDFPGYLVIQLRSIIYVTGFTMEHVSKLILPNENMSSAPKKFEVWGLTSENDPEPVLFGDYEFAFSDENLQYFPVQNTAINRPYEYVELKIHSNHGQLDYTCLYRFRVHGRPA